MSEQYYSGDLALIHPGPNHKEKKKDSLSLDIEEKASWLTSSPGPIVTFPPDLEKRLQLQEEKSLKTFLQNCQQNQVPYSVLCVYGTFQIIFALIFYFSRDFLFIEYILYVLIMAPFVKIVLTIYIKFDKSDGMFSPSCGCDNVTPPETWTIKTKHNLKIIFQSIFPISWVRIFMVGNGSHNISKSIKFELCVAYFLMIQAYYGLILILPGFKLDDWYSLTVYYSSLLASMSILNHIVVHSKARSLQIMDMLDSATWRNLLLLIILPLRLMPSLYDVKARKYRSVPWITTLYFLVVLTVYHMSTILHINFHYGVESQVVSVVLPFLLLEFGWLPCTPGVELRLVELFHSNIYRPVYATILAILILAHIANIILFPAVFVLFILYLIVGILNGFILEGWYKSIQFLAVMFCIYIHALLLYLSDHHLQRVF